MADSTTTDMEKRPDVRTVPPPGSASPSARVIERVPATPERSPVRGGGVAAGNGYPDDPEDMRREIERTRARMSDTLDALEARLVFEKRELERKKDELWEKATLQGVRRKLSREPWRSVAIAFAAGYIVAALRD